MMKIVFLFTLLVGLLSCTNSGTDKSKDIVTTSEIQFAKTLSIQKKGTSILVHITNPDNQKIKKFLLSKESNPIIPKEYTFIKIPVTRTIALSGTHIGMISKLDKIDALIGVSNKNYIYNAKVLSLVKKGIIKDYIGEESLSFEQIIASKAQLLLYSGFGKEFPREEQLLKLGTVCMANYDWKEEHPLGKAEWIKLFGCLYDKEEEANLYFKNLVSEYNELIEIAKKSTSKPSVISGNIIGDFWYAPAGNSFIAHFFKDANTNYRYANTEDIGSLELSLEKVISENIETDYWFNPGYPTLKKVLKSNPKATFLKSFQTKNVYCYSPKMNLFWEMSAIEPHHVLSDLIRILHPEMLPKKKLYYYEKLK